MFSDHNGLKRETNSNKISGKTPNIWKLNDKLLSNSWTEDKITRELRKYLKLKKPENAIYQNL